MVHGDYLKQITTDLDKSGINQPLLRRYDTENRLNRKALATRSGLIRTMRIFGVFIDKPLESTVKDDVLNWLDSLKHHRSGAQLKDGTIKRYVSDIKVFFKWLNGGEEYPTSVKWLKNAPNEKNDVLRVLAPDDIHRMAEKCNTQRDRALFMTLFDSAGRIGEILTMSVKDVEIDRFGAVLMITGKTGPRRIRIIDAVPDLQMWLSLHPQKDNPDAPLWISRLGSGIKYSYAHRMCQNLGKLAGIKIKTHPHLLRHSRLTILAKNLTDAELRVFAGWDAGSGQAKTYIHLSGADIDDKLLKIGGVKKEDMEEPTETATTPKDCPRCQTRNPPTAKYCFKCGAVLDLKTAMYTDDKQSDALMELMELMSEHPEIVENLKLRASGK